MSIFSIKCTPTHSFRQVQSVLSTVGGARPQRHRNRRGSREEHGSSMVSMSLGQRSRLDADSPCDFGTILGKAEFI